VAVEGVIRLDINDRIATARAAAEATAVVMKGGVVLYPSDTVYGLLCRSDHRNSVERVRRMKGYDEERPFILLVGGPEMAGSLADCSDPEIAGIMETRWPGRLTIVLPALSRCPPWVMSPDGEVALRAPDHELSRMILENCGIPLVSTSANMAGDRTCLDFSEIPRSITGAVDLAVDAGMLPFSRPSTIIKLLRGR